MCRESIKSFGAYKTRKEIIESLKEDERILAQLVLKCPFLPHEWGWYLWIVWAKLEYYKFKRGREPVREVIYVVPDDSCYTKSRRVLSKKICRFSVER